jgi:outer membrane cobalamin receptor
MKKFLIILIFLTCLNSQFQKKEAFFIIKGVVIDKETNSPIEYASVSIFNQKDSSFAGGVLTDSKGQFMINVNRPGLYFLRITFLGYEKKEISSIKITPENRILDIGKIYLEVSSIVLETKEVVSEPLPITYKVDKKVIEVSKIGTSLSGTAIDILKNVPSVNVDVEGNIKLRGSENFLLYIDGRQSPLPPSDALQQIPASSIERIEIITNPSAKYEAEGTSGIINIVLKKGKGEGVNGVINLNAGLNEKYGGDVVLNYKSENIKVFFNLNYNKRSFKEEISSEREIYDKEIKSNGETKRIFNPYGLRAGIDFDIKNSNRIGILANYGLFNMKNKGFSKYEEISDTLKNSYKTNGFFERKGPFFEIVLNDEQKFKGENHNLYTEFSYNIRNGDERNESFKRDSLNYILSGNKRFESGFSNRFTSRIEYFRPFNKYFKIETGYRGEYSLNKDKTDFYVYDVEEEKFEIVDSMCHEVKYKNNVQAIYSLFRGELKNAGYQIGLRIEYNDRKIEYTDTNLIYTFKKIDYFPTFHFSYKFLKANEIFLSYSRRITRPRDFWLEPLLTWIDAYNVRKGNPDLKPEYIDNFETGINKEILKGSFTFETYYRIINNKIERLRIPYNDSVFLHTPLNAGKSFSFGNEISFNKNIFKILTINPVFDFYFYKLKGKIYGEEVSKEEINYNLRFNLMASMPFSSRLQVISIYTSPTNSFQGKEREFITFDLSFQKFFLNRNLILNLQVRDIFKTSKRGFEIDERDYKYYQTFKHEAPILILTLTYNFKGYKAEKKIRKEIEEEREEFEY